MATMVRNWCAVIAVAPILLVGDAARATEVAVNTPSFEHPGTPIDGFEKINTLHEQSTLGWTVDPTVFVVGDEFDGVFADAPDGDQWVSLASNSAVYQQVGTVDPGLVYSLSIVVSDRSDDITPGAFDFGLWADTNGNGLFETKLGVRDETTLTGIVDDNGVADIQSASVTFYGDALPAGVTAGDPMYIALRNTEPFEGTTQVAFDQVRLTTAPVPEPTAIALVGMGGLALFGRRCGRAPVQQ